MYSASVPPAMQRLLDASTGERRSNTVTVVVSSEVEALSAWM